jgi:hypothetical protein
MPQVVASSGPAASIPAAALQGPMKILKRATPAAHSSTPSPTPADGPQSYAVREARYQAARQRIFADPDAVGKDDKGVEFVRQPLGPDQEQGAAAGFAGRRGKSAGKGAGLWSQTSS